MATITAPQTSWLHRLTYIPADRTLTLPAGIHGLLLVETTKGDGYLYAVPSWVIGLVAAARSKGRAFNLLVKGKYQGAKVEPGILPSAKVNPSVVPS